jgi:hypothetical protein
MVDLVNQRLRDLPIEAQLEEIKELLNREHSPVIKELRQRFNELVTALNPQGVAPTAGAATDFLLVTINSTEYAIQLHARS